MRDFPTRHAPKARVDLIKKISYVFFEIHFVDSCPEAFTISANGAEKVHTSLGFIRFASDPPELCPNCDAHLLIKNAQLPHTTRIPNPP